MSNIDKQALREAAEKVNSGNWSYEEFSELGLPGGAYIKIDGRDAIYCLNKPTGGIEQSRAVLAYIAAFNPKVALALLDELEADKEQIKTLESRNRRLDGIIDAAEKRVAELECIATDYGVKFQKAQDALKHQALLHKSQMEATEKRIAELEAREVMLPDRKSEIFWPGDAFEFDILGYVIAVKSAIRAAGIKVKE
ncbi:ead/Ea22-like family protein [Salmonella enterica]|nr:ead/Ea22-like family protein [Salmonella enterica]